MVSKVGERQRPGLSTAAPGVAQLYVQFRVSGGGWAETSPSFHYTDGEMGTYTKAMNLSLDSS